MQEINEDAVPSRWRAARLGIVYGGALGLAVAMLTYIFFTMIERNVSKKTEWAVLAAVFFTFCMIGSVYGFCFPDEVRTRNDHISFDENGVLFVNGVSIPNQIKNIENGLWQYHRPNNDTINVTEETSFIGRARTNNIS